MISLFVSLKFKPHIRLSAVSTEPASDPLSLSLSLCPLPACSLSPSLLTYFKKMFNHEFSVDMTLLNKLGGVEFDIGLPNKKFCINSEHSVDLLLETVGKTGKALSYLSPK
uniref:Uncharacterized protein n=1 Tax=Suricata suricatta TaxID=37032 RepID=A0A673SZU6_SURSU